MRPAGSAPSFPALGKSLLQRSDEDVGRLGTENRLSSQKEGRGGESPDGGRLVDVALDGGGYLRGAKVRNELVNIQAHHLGGSDERLRRELATLEQNSLILEVLPLEARGVGSQRRPLGLRAE